jgi:hypothetical protein
VEDRLGAGLASALCCGGLGSGYHRRGDNFGPPPVAALLLILLALILFLIWFVGLVVVYIRWLEGREPDPADHSNR